MSIKVLLVDEHRLVRAGLRLLLADHDDIDVIGEAEDGDSCLRAVRKERPDVVLLDIALPGMDGVLLTHRLIRDRFVPDIRVIVLTAREDDDHIVDALRAGARGFLVKDIAPDRLVDAIRVVAAGDAFLAPSVTRRLLERFAERLTTGAAEQARLATVSERETEVIRLLARGMTNREIAEQLVVSEPTVKSHISHVLVKLGLRDRTQAVILAYEAGLIRPGAIASMTPLALAGR
jgi:DNA-binding NarL/FixJ family response regulator